VGGVARRDAALLAALGVVAMWFSQTAVLVLGGIAFGLTANCAVGRDWPALRRLALVYAAWAASFVPWYLVSARYTVHSPYMDAFWGSGFMPTPNHLRGMAVWLYQSLNRVFVEPLGLASDDPFGHAVRRVGLVAKLAGVVGVTRAAWAGDGRWLLILGPIVATLGASGVHLFPFGSTLQGTGRVILFLAPMFLLVVAAGADVLRRIPVLGMAAYAYMLAWPLYPLAKSFPWHREGEEVKEVMAYVAKHRRPEDAVYVYYNARPAFSYYARRYGFPDTGYVVGQCSPRDPGAYLRVLPRLANRPRVWLLFTHVEWSAGVDERAVALAYMDRLGTKLDEYENYGTSAHLYDLRARRGTDGAAPISEPPVPQPPVPALYCDGPSVLENAPDVAGGG
jgi:hypothetical protein